MKKVCVFCGKNPTAKTKEHVIPKWLIEYTGNPKRTFNIGPIYGSARVVRQLSADQFHFPACESCNSKYSDLEGQTSRIVVNMCEGNLIKTSDLHSLLDWLDKVRIGLWLGFRYLCTDFWGIDPKFHIEQRMGQQDRGLLIYRMKGKSRGVNFAGVNSPIFAYMPSAFLLRINNFFLYNFSYHGAFSSRLGFPRITSQRITKSGMSDIEMEEGVNRIMNPILRDRFPDTKNIFLQGIVPRYPEIRNGISQEARIYIDSHSILPGSGKSQIADGYANIWASEESYKLKESRTENSLKDSFSAIGEHCWRKLETIYRSMEFDHESISHEEREVLKAEQRSVLRAHKKMLSLRGEKQSSK